MEKDVNLPPAEADGFVPRPRSPAKSVKKELLSIIDAHKDDIIKDSVEYVYNNASDLKGKRPKEETEKLVNEYYESLKEFLITNDNTRLNNFIDYVVKYRGNMGFNISTTLIKFASFKKAVIPVLKSECKDSQCLVEMITVLDDLYDYSIFRFSDIYMGLSTKRLNDKIWQLEQFEEIAVGREIKMIELKERIKELEKKINEKKEG